jgi:nitronate monooxygenase
MAGEKVLKTRLCEMLGIKYPILLAGMGSTSGPSLVAAVSNAGGLGVLGAALLSPDTVRLWTLFCPASWGPAWRFPVT